MPSLLPVSGHGRRSRAFADSMGGRHEHVIVFKKLHVCAHVGDLSTQMSVVSSSWNPRLGVFSAQVVTYLLHVDHDEAIHFGILLLCIIALVRLELDLLPEVVSISP